MAERYERKSILITSNLVISEWDRIFKNPMSTAAAIDRLVHQSTILEFSGRSKRADEAESRSRATADTPWVRIVVASAADTGVGRETTRAWPITA